MNNDLLKPTGETYKIKCHIICNTLNDENEEMIVAVNSIYAIAWRSLKKIQDFNGVWTRDLAITGAILTNAMLYSTNFFFQASLRNCINCVHCDDHLFIFISFPQFIYDLFHISLTLSMLSTWFNAAFVTCNILGEPNPNRHRRPILNPSGSYVPTTVSEHFSQQ